VPPALPVLIKKFTKEVIRYSAQRPNIVEFAKDYFTATVNGELGAFLDDCETDALAANSLIVAQTNTVKQTPAVGQSKKATHMLRSVFNVLDRDLNDSLTLDELNKGIEGTPLGDMWCPFFEALVDPNDPIDFETFVGWWSPIPDRKIEKIRSEWLENYFNKKHNTLVVDFLTRLFYKWDTDRSGSIAIDEVVEAMKSTTLFGHDEDPAMNAAIRQKNVSRIMRSDTNQDGTISIREFLAFMDDGIPDEAVPGLMKSLGLEDVVEHDWGK